jgi:3-hydroxybutyrate dehydrogenase/3-oxoacyl-[acyl-carrier protein] reductase
MSAVLKGKTAVVTGGSRGIGRAIAEAFLGAGATVVISGRDEEKGRRALSEIDAGDALAFHRADARSRAETEALTAAAAARFGRVDVLVNNAGGASGFGPLVKLTDEAWREAGDWILNSAFWATRAVLPGMLEAGWGRIISISSVESKTLANPLAAHYATFKLALNGLMRCVAAEYGPAGVTANSICPGAVATDMMKITGAEAAALVGMNTEQLLDAYAQQSLTKQINTVEQVAAVALLLASPAGSGITGTTINVDAGTAAH